MSLLNYFGKSKTAFKPYVLPWKFICDDSVRSFQVGDMVYTHDKIVINKNNDTNMITDSEIISVITSKQTAMRMLEILNSAFEKDFVDFFDGETRAQEAAPVAPVVTPYPVHEECRKGQREYHKAQREEYRKKMYPILRTALPESTDGLYYEISISNTYCYGHKTHKSVLSTIVASHEISKVLDIKMDLDNTRVTRERISLPILKYNHMFSMFYHQDKRCEIMEDMIKQLVTDVHRLQTQLEQSQQSNEIKFKRLSSKTITEEILDVDIPIATLIAKS